MAKIWQDIEITWNGETHTFRPTLAFINQLEQGPGRSIGHVLYRLSIGDLPSVAACEIIAKAVNWAQKDDPEADRITPEDVYAETAGGGQDVIDMVQTILVACMPAPKETTKKKPTKRKASAPKPPKE